MVARAERRDLRRFNVRTVNPSYEITGRLILFADTPARARARYASTDSALRKLIRFVLLIFVSRRILKHPLRLSPSPPATDCSRVIGGICRRKTGAAAANPSRCICTIAITTSPKSRARRWETARPPSLISTHTCSPILALAHNTSERARARQCDLSATPARSTRPRDCLFVAPGRFSGEVRKAGISRTRELVGRGIQRPSLSVFRVRN